MLSTADAHLLPQTTVGALGVAATLSSAEQFQNQLETRWQNVPVGDDPASERHQIGSLLRVHYLSRMDQIPMSEVASVNTPAGILQVHDTELKAVTLLKRAERSHVFSQSYTDGSEIRYYSNRGYSYEVLLQPMEPGKDREVARLRERHSFTAMAKLALASRRTLDKVNVEGKVVRLGDSPDKLRAVLNRPDACGDTTLFTDHSSGATEVAYRYRASDGEYVLVFTPQPYGGFSLTRILPPARRA